MTEKKGGNKPTSPKPSSGGTRTLGESTNPVNKSDNLTHTTTGSTGPKGPKNKK